MSVHTFSANHIAPDRHELSRILDRFVPAGLGRTHAMHSLRHHMIKSLLATMQISASREGVLMTVDSACRQQTEGLAGHPGLAEMQRLAGNIAELSQS